LVPAVIIKLTRKREGEIGEFGGGETGEGEFDVI
jgi:hypothetical protein